jgi:hypothetical protein
MTSQLNVVIKATDRATPAFKRLTSNLQGIERQLKGASADFQRFAKAQIQGSQQAARAAQELANKYQLIEQRASSLALKRMARGDLEGASAMRQRAAAAGELANKFGQLAPSTKTVSDRFKEFGTSLKKAGTVMFGITASVGAAVFAMKKAFDFGKEGAMLQRLEDSGESLAKSYGTSMDKIVEAVDRAADGTVAQSDIILAANKAMLLGVADSAGEMAQLMDVAAVRAKAMGLTTTQAFNDIVTGIGRMSPMILDNLGIVTGGARVFDEFAANIGKSADQLTDAEKKQALFNKVMQDTAPLLDATAKAAGDTATSYEQLSASSKNFADETKKSAGEVFEPMVVWLNEAFQKTLDYREGVDLLGLSMIGTNRYIDEHGKVLTLTNQQVRDMAAAYAGANVELIEANEAGTQWIIDAKKMRDAAGEVADSVDDIGIAFADLRTNVPSDIDALLTKISFLQSGGEDLQLAFEAARDAIQNSADPPAKADQLQGVLTALATHIDRVEKEAEEAGSAVNYLNERLRALPARIRSEVQVHTRYTFSGTPPGGGSGGAHAPSPDTTFGSTSAFETTTAGGRQLVE